LPLGRFGERWDARPRFEGADVSRLRNEIQADLARGAQSLWLALDWRASLQNARQLGELLADVPLERVTLSLDVGAAALPAAACLVAAAGEHGVPPQRLKAWLNADPLGSLAREGALPGSLDAARDEAVALARWAAEHAPGVRALGVSVVTHHDAGASAAQELAYALATGVSYLRWLCDAGMSLAAACRQLAFTVAVGSDFFVEIAKLRALREAWASVVASCGGDAQAQSTVIHATTATRDKTRRDPWVNLLRETTQAFSAAVGGADAITTAGFDRLLGVSDAFARRIAQNVQVVLDEEAHVARVADPGGGSYYVESLTEQLAARAWSLLQRIEAEGGMAQAVTSGRVAAQIAEVAQARAALIAKRRQPVTGVSEYAHVAETAVERPALERMQAAPAAGSALRLSGSGAALVQSAIEAARQGAGIEVNSFLIRSIRCFRDS
jgi:methylmalonyl-CoA mutase